VTHDTKFDIKARELITSGFPIRLKGNKNFNLFRRAVSYKHLVTQHPEMALNKTAVLFIMLSPGFCYEIAYYHFDETNVALTQFGIGVLLDREKTLGFWLRTLNLDTFFNTTQRLRGENGKQQKSAVEKAEKKEKE
jgi:hypothetical protein